MPVEIKMARPLKRRVREAGYAAVVVIGERDRPTHRLQAAQNIDAVLPALQLGNFRLLEIADLIWTPGLNAARTIVVAAENDLSGFRLAPHWYCAELPTIRSRVAEAAAAICCQTWSHEAMVAWIKTQELAEADQFVAECGWAPQIKIY